MNEFWNRADRSGGPGACWPWRSTLNNGGYGHYSLSGVVWMAHRYAVILDGREIPQGMVIDHLCRNRACVNPRHLEVVTHAENNLRGNSFSAVNARKTQCVNGHEFTPENTARRKRGASLRRACRICEAEGKRRWQLRQRSQEAS